METPSTGFWPKRYTLVLLCFAATVVCYLDRVNISVAALAMQERFGWTETTKGLVLSSFFIGTQKCSDNWAARVGSLPVVRHQSRRCGRSTVADCGALGALAFNGSGFAPNHPDIAPQHAAVLMGVTNTVATVPGIVGVAVTGWLVETTGSYSSAFILTAAISVLGAIVWLAFAATTPADRRRN